MLFHTANLRTKAKRQRLRRKITPHLVEILLVAGGYLAYMYAKTIPFKDSTASAFNNARRLIDVERSIGLLWEPTWQAWVLDAPAFVILFFNWVYAFAYWPVIVPTVVVLYIRNRKRYRFYRNWIFASYLAAMTMFLLFPLAPPRMLADMFVDTIAVFGPSFYMSRDFAEYYNAFAAMPSLHFAWTLIFGIMFFSAGPRWLKVVGVLYPTLTLIAIMVTGNHYVLDAIAGGVVAVGALGILHLGKKFTAFARRRIGVGITIRR